jgi:hypothetical protein
VKRLLVNSIVKVLKGKYHKQSVRNKMGLRVVGLGSNLSLS